MKELTGQRLDFKGYYGYAEAEMYNVNVKIGCCGFPVGRKKYFQNLSVVEVQQTFYQLPKVETVERWRKEAPKGFEFTMKAFQLITHEVSSPTYRRLRTPIPETKKQNYGSFKPTLAVYDAWKRTEGVAKALGVKLVVFQCPSSFKPTEGNKKNLQRFFSKIERGNLICVWEPRGEWEAGDIKGLCKALDLIHCVDPFKSESLYGSPKYFRLHGKTGYRYQFSKEDLLWLKERLPEDVCYLMFNNISMFEDALRLKEIIYGKHH